METANISGTADGGSAFTQEYQSSNSYDPAPAEPAVSAVLSPISTTPVDPSKSNNPTSNTTSKPALAHFPVAVATSDLAADRQSQSRSMSRGSSSASSSSNVIITEQTNDIMPSQSAQQAVVPSVNGASVSSPPASRVLAVVDPSNTISSGTDVQGRAVSNATPVPNLDGAVETPFGTPSQSGAEISAVPVKAPPQDVPNVASVLPKARLPHDKIGMLEDRIKDDPRGDIEAWLGLIDEHKRRSKSEDARSTYEKFLSLFPFAAEVWVSYAQMENEANNRNGIDNVLGKSLIQMPYLPLWSVYLDHVRRHNNLTTDTSGTGRQIIHQAYELAVVQVGLDKDAGRMWQDYILFLKSGPGILGGSNWQDQQKMDELRKTYQQAICVPTQATNTLWKEYDGFEMGLNKMTGRKFLQDQSPAYMSARASYTELQNITRNLKRTTLPSLPPALGFEGDTEYLEQLSIWKRWIRWEIDDPLVLKQDDLDGYKARVIFVYKHALMAMRFWPELWCDASEFCFANNMDEAGDDFLKQGIAANPESCLLAFKRADRIEFVTSSEEGEEKTLRRAASVREPFDKVLDALYELIARSKAREEQDLALIEVQHQVSVTEQPTNGIAGDEKGDEDEELRQEDMKNREKQKAERIEATKNVHAVQMHARKRGRVTSDVYVQAALIEFHCYEPDTGRKIFERGLKLFQEDEAFALEYIKHLVANNDHTNARVVFETVVTRLAHKPETTAKAKPLYAFFHDFESRYGELSQIVKLEKRMSDLFPEDPSLALFSKRFSDDGFDPTAIRPIISPAKQTKPKFLPTIQAIAPEAQFIQVSTNSPKRPLPLDESDNESDRPRKAMRGGASPLKPAPAQPMIKQNSQQSHQQIPLQSVRPPLPQSYAIPPLPRDITYLLSIIPKAETYTATKFNPAGLVRLIRETHVPTHISQLPPQAARGVTGASHPPPPPQHIPPPQTPQLQGPPPPYVQPGSVPPMQQRPGLPPMPQVPPVGYPPYPVPAGTPYYSR
ncbi:uncharacterized protein KY384_005817 [Bacidia gigantensis]|uniref:uncharacterized protein n=1 Tax=Bacidia gigantensis TaxID=2732470 RepID=UPI001D03D348|nr:uncharacterized protein KY384_005817 [Bacidia gigantensis]KAG8529182.1 hypothetical protein KY384_005817 [Bacidia gigantensis]